MNLVKILGLVTFLLILNFQINAQVEDLIVEQTVINNEKVKLEMENIGDDDVTVRYIIIQDEVLMLTEEERLIKAGEKETIVVYLDLQRLISIEVDVSIKEN